MTDRNTNMPHLLRRGKMKLLSVKDSDVRLLTLEPCRSAIDHGLHAGGALSAAIPHRRSTATAHVHSINTLDGEGRPRFIHSGTYEELLQTFGLAPDAIAATIKEKLNGSKTDRPQHVGT